MSKERPFVPDNSPKPGSEELRGEIDKLNKEGWEDNAVVRVVKKGEDPAKQREILETGGECKDLRTYIHLHSEQFASADEVTAALGKMPAFGPSKEGTTIVIDRCGNKLNTHFNLCDVRKRLSDDLGSLSLEKGMVLFSLLYKAGGGQIKRVDIKEDLIEELSIDKIRKTRQDLVDRLSLEREKNPPRGTGDNGHDRWVAENRSKLEPVIHAAFDSLEKLGFIMANPTSKSAADEKKEIENLKYCVDEILCHRTKVAHTEEKEKGFEF